MSSFPRPHTRRAHRTRTRALLARGRPRRISRGSHPGRNPGVASPSGTDHAYKLSDHEIQSPTGRRKARRTREKCGTHFRLLKKAHLLGPILWMGTPLTRALAAAYLEYAWTHLWWVPRPALAALHLGPF